MLNNKAFKRLAEKQNDYCVSIYVPAHDTDTGTESRSFLKRMLKDVSDELIGKGMSDKDAKRFLFNAYELLQEVELWKHLQNSFALFITEDQFESYKLPYEAGPFFYVGKRFYLRPLLPAVNGTERFYLLKLSEDQAALLEGNRNELHPVGADVVLPDNLEAALERENSEQNVQRNRGSSAYESPIYENEDMGADHNLKQYKRYAYQVDLGVKKAIADERTPLVLATTDQIAPIYKDTSDYLEITPVHISGKPEDKSEAQLHEKAVEIINNFHHGRQEQRAKAFDEYDKDGKASASVFEVVAKAYQGEVNTLFVAQDQHSWGSYQDKNETVELHKERQADSVDLLDLAATHTHLHGGKVYFLPKDKMPQDSTNVCAIFK